MTKPTNAQPNSNQDDAIIQEGHDAVSEKGKWEKLTPLPTQPCGLNAGQDEARAAEQEGKIVANPSTIAGYGFGKD